MKKKTTALARTTKRTITRPARETSIVPFQRTPDGAIALPNEQKFQGASSLVLPQKTSSALMRTFAPPEYDILPSGECYVSHVFVRRRLNEVLGLGQWALVPVGNPTIQDEKVIVREFYFYVRSHFIRSVYGEAGYEKSNRRMSWGDALEAAYSNAITRGVKELGIASECWDKRWTEQWKRANAVRVWTKGPKDEEASIKWRRKDGEPLRWEKGLVTEGHESPPSSRNQRPAAVDADTVEGISRQEAEDLIDLARAKGVTPSALSTIIGSETGQTKIKGIRKTQYGKIKAIVEKIVVSKG